MFACRNRRLLGMRAYRRVTLIARLLVFVAFVACAGRPVSAESPASKGRGESPASLATLEKQSDRFANFEKSLSGAALVGHSTTTGDNNTKLEPERYELTSVKHVDDDRWLFTARIRYGDHDVTLPLTLPVRWAGDTPVITVDNMGFPGLGTYTARVMIYANHYAGFWSGGDHGGHLFGVIEKPQVFGGIEKPQAQ